MFLPGVAGFIYFGCVAGIRKRLIEDPIIERK
jgi:hypothetical protein